MIYIIKDNSGFIYGATDDSEIAKIIQQKAQTQLEYSGSYMTASIITTILITKNSLGEFIK